MFKFCFSYFEEVVVVVVFFVLRDRHFSPRIVLTCCFSAPALCMTVPSWLTLKNKRSFVHLSTLPFMSSHLVAALVNPASTSNRDAKANSRLIFPLGGQWLSQSAHLSCCFYNGSHLFLPLTFTCQHLHRDIGCHRPFYRKRVCGFLFPSSYQRLCMNC